MCSKLGHNFNHIYVECRQNVGNRIEIIPSQNSQTNSPSWEFIIASYSTQMESSTFLTLENVKKQVKLLEKVILKEHGSGIGKMTTFSKGIKHN